MKTGIVILIVVVLLALMLAAPLAAQDEDISARGYTFQKFDYALGAPGFYQAPWIIGWRRGFYKTPWLMGWRRGFSPIAALW